MGDLPAGWGYPTMTARKAHYFPEGQGRSLCGRYGRFMVPTTPDDGPSPEDCAACRRALDAQPS